MLNKRFNMYELVEVDTWCINHSRLDGTTAFAVLVELDFVREEVGAKYNRRGRTPYMICSHTALTV